ncbi:unnamed protein product [Larinioides sclopetarius]|uniref:Uncharacterized protein n=1 Tax=Larinioides sclopetarius TaxID=280406 RepID=A0AAV2BS94_9ARAC
MEYIRRKIHLQNFELSGGRVGLVVMFQPQEWTPYTIEDTPSCALNPICSQMSSR